MQKNIFNKKKQVFLYVALDVIVSIVVWFCFFSYRKFTELSYEQPQEIWHLIFSDVKFYLGIVIIPICWVTLFALTGTYNQIWRKSRLKEFISTFQQVLFGSLILFFVIILDDIIESYTDYIRLFLVLFSLQFILLTSIRLIYLTILKKKIRTGKIQFNTIVIGTVSAIEDVYKILFDPVKTFGNNFIGYISVENSETNPNLPRLPFLGYYTEIDKLIKKHDIEEVIITYDSVTRGQIENILPLVGTNRVLLKILPNKEEHILRTVKNTAVFNEPYMQIYLDAMPLWQKLCKRTMDIVVSFIFIVFASPLYLFLSIGVKRSSSGKIFYRQERIGKNGKPFKIIKFRSMYEDAEADGCPRLSSQNDGRITKFGVFMRRTHLDEIPQFFNVLKGDMALVGPRPERQYYIDQIVQRAPYYRLLLLVKPGITSWGQVSFGYAENVDQMIERLRYDIMYFENMSLLMDIKILFYTVLAVLKRDGK
jgi:exopolysaccharide biosynthesis polyprenyl glycosylphosphotransferase